MLNVCHWCHMELVEWMRVQKQGVLRSSKSILMPNPIFKTPGCFDWEHLFSINPICPICGAQVTVFSPTSPWTLSTIIAWNLNGITEAHRVDQIFFHPWTSLFEFNPSVPFMNLEKKLTPRWHGIELVPLELRFIIAIVFWQMFGDRNPARSPSKGRRLSRDRENVAQPDDIGVFHLALIFISE